MAQRILVCGDRDLFEYNEIYAVLSEFPTDSVVIHGDCKGADKMGAFVAELLGMSVMAFPADWKRHGRAAGPIRNKRMLDEGRPDVVIAFHDNLSRSRGTKNMINQACERGIDVILIDTW